MLSNRTYRIDESGGRVDGVFLMAFIDNGDYYLEPIGIFRDGMVECWELVPFEEFRELVRSGWVATRPPPGATIRISSLGRFTATDSLDFIDPEEFIREVADEIEQLNGRPTSSDRCRAAWDAYRAAPSASARDALRSAYEAIPEHNRMYVLHNQDAKDHAIRRVLYPEQYERDG